MVSLSNHDSGNDDVTGDTLRQAQGDSTTGGPEQPTQ